MTEEQKQQFPEVLADVFTRTENDIYEAAGENSTAFVTGMILHYGRTRKWLQTMMDLANAKQEKEMGEFIRAEIFKIDDELTFRKDDR